MVFKPAASALATLSPPLPRLKFASPVVELQELTELDQSFVGPGNQAIFVQSQPTPAQIISFAAPRADHLHPLV